MKQKDHSQNKKQLFGMIRIIAIALIVLLLLRGRGVLILLIALSLFVSFLVAHFPIRQIGVELVTFIAVLSGLKYGPWTALLITFILISYHLVAGGFFAVYVLWVIPAYCIAAVISGFLPQADVTQLGVILTFAININNTFWTAITGPAFLPRYIPYVVTNILFNVLLFSILGPLFMGLVG